MSRLSTPHKVYILCFHRYLLIPRLGILVHTRGNLKKSKSNQADFLAITITPKDIHSRPCAIVFCCRVEGLHNCVTVRGQKFLYSSTINKTFVQIEKSKGEESIFHARIIPVKGGTNSFHQLMRKCNSQMITFSVLIISPFFLNFFHSIWLTLGKTFIFSYRPSLCVWVGGS